MGKSVFAASVTLEGGQQVTTEDDRVFPDRSQRFAGVVSFFHTCKGFGFIKPKEDFKPKPTPEELKERRLAGKKRKREQAKKQRKKEAAKMKKKMKKGFKMNGMTFIPMPKQQSQPQIMMMNGQPFMVMPNQGQFGGFGGMQFPGMNMVGFGQQPKKKKRKRNNKKKNKNNKTELSFGNKVW